MTIEFDFLNPDGPAEKLGQEPTVYPVSTLTKMVRSLLESEIGEVWVEGEISNFRKQASGHQYFTLKDGSAQLSCVLFRNNARNLDTPLQEGMQVQACGDLSVYEARGQYQLIVRQVQGSGQGALQLKFEALKRQLDSEGLFDNSLKKRIPAFPATVAIVTSPTGAAIRDMLSVMQRRAPWIHILVYPVRVQGTGCEKEIADAIRRLDTDGGNRFPRPDVIVVTRGGGSIEDLWGFNEEAVARAIYDSGIPVVSAVGHEIDFTIADFTADLRAPTPSAAAELIAPDTTELEHRFESFEQGMRRRVEDTLSRWGKILELHEKGALTHTLQRVLQSHAQAIDLLENDLSRTACDRLADARTQLLGVDHILQRHHPGQLLKERLSHITLLEQQLTHRAQTHVRRGQNLTEKLAALLQSLGPQAVFSRGFSMTTDSEGHPVTDVSALSPGQPVTTRLDRGSFTSTVESLSGK